jgi:hypothetical protein
LAPRKRAVPATSGQGRNHRYLNQMSIGGTKN